MPRRRTILFSALLLLARAASASDFAAGYASGVLDEFGVRGASVSVDGATVTVTAAGLSASEKDGLSRALGRAPGIDAVRFRDAARASGGSGPEWLPRRPLFEPLMADPRWPRLSGTLVRYRGDELGRVWAANFGATVPLLGGETRRGARWQWAAQASVFTLWNMDTLSNDHINADYLVGFPAFWRWDKVSAMARVYHISSHLGDEYMLTHPATPRVNLSYEAVDAVLSYQALPSLRLYGGAGYLYRRDPKGTPPGALQAGLEYRHPETFWKRRLRPVAGVDLQKHQKSGWASTDVSARAGLSLEHRSFASRHALLLLEYYRGKDPNGQFFRRSVQHAGLGLSVFY